MKIHDGLPRTITYVTDVLGQVLSRVEDADSPFNPAVARSTSYWFGGRKVADVTNNGDDPANVITVVEGRVPDTAPPQGPRGR